MSVEESVDRRTPLIGLLLDYARDAPLLQRAALVATGALVLLAALRLLRLLAVELRPVARRVAALGLVMWVTGMLVVDKVAVHLLAGDPAVYDVGVGVEEILELLALACLLWAFSDDPPRFDAPMSPPAATSTQRPTSSHGSNAIP